MIPAELSALVWPLTLILCVLVVLRKLRSDLSPITREVVTGLANHAKTYSLAYALAMCYGAAASLQALGDVAKDLGWVYIGAAAKVMQPGIVAIIAFVNRVPEARPAKPPTQPPFSQ
jgi:membrane-associated HD superfamily phosphohydrolase